MTSGREGPTGYDWEDDAIPAEPAPLALPDRGAGGGPRAGAGHGDAWTTPAGSGDARSVGPQHGAADDTGPYGAPTFTYDPPQGQGEEPAPRRGLPPAAIVAIVALQATALVLSVGLVVSGVTKLVGPDPAPPSAGAGTADPTAGGTAPATSAPSTPATVQERTPGVVTDSAGREVTDGTGRYDHPADVGEHTVSWNTWTGGTLAVTPLTVDLAATVPRAEERDVVQDGYRLVLVTYEAEYDGPGRFAPAEELWPTGESDLTYFPDVGEGLVPDPMRGVDPLAAGESAQFRSAFLVPENELSSFRLALETFSGETLYFAT